jgi:hypothetical protein
MKVFITVIVTLLIHLPTSSYAHESPHRLFQPLTENDVRTAFATYEAKCKNGEKIKFGMESPIDFPVQKVRGVEALRFNVGIMPPISQVQKWGYEFGKLGRARTEADKESILKRLVERMKEAPRVIPFYATIESRSDWSTSVNVSFALVNENGITILPQLQPNFDCAEKDLICQVAMSESGAEITFPLYIKIRDNTPAATLNTVPFVTDQMRVLRLIVTMGDAKQELSFDLNSIR